MHYASILFRTYSLISILYLICRAKNMKCERKWLIITKSATMSKVIQYEQDIIKTETHFK